VIALMVALGAVVGAPARYLTDRAVQRRNPTRLPVGTLTVNLVASFVFGTVVGAMSDVSTEVSALLTTGFCGALSTFSTFGYETVALVERRATTVAVVNVVVSVVAGVLVAWLGYLLGRALV
jgi:CrcB protein